MNWTRTTDEPIVTSLLDTDFYKFTMGQLIFQSYPKIEVEFGLINRSGAPLANFVREDELRAELDHVQSLRFNNSDLHYLRGTNEYGERMFGEGYLQFLKDLQLPPYQLDRLGDSYSLSFRGGWAAVTYWEIYGLEILSELYYRAQLRTLGNFARDMAFATGTNRLQNKIDRLRDYWSITFSDLGTRRRFSRKWQRYLVGILAEELPKQFLGTSNTELAMVHGLLPMGTSAHERNQVLAALAFEQALEGEDDQEILATSQKTVLDEWWKMYGHGLSIALTDTYGSDFFFRTAPAYAATDWKGTRQDSGQPDIYGEKAIQWYNRHLVDPRAKLTVFSDQLDIRSIVGIHNKFYNRLGHTFGWGTNLTNDLGFKTISIVIKVLKVNGHSAVKLSDNLVKALGDAETVERYKKAAGYTNTEAMECIS